MKNTADTRALLEESEKKIPRFEAELLLAHATRKTRAFLLAHPEFSPSTEESARFESFVDRRGGHEPIALIVGRKEFYGREFLVNESTLIPRPETELLIEAVLDHVRQSDARSILVVDVGTGSGNIVSTLAKEAEAIGQSEKKFSFVATDISEKAIETARRNAKRLEVGENIKFFLSDLMENIPKEIFSKREELVVAANLPYLSKQEFAETPNDVRLFEPKTALLSGEDGLDHYRRLLEYIQRATAIREQISKVSIFLEIGPSQMVTMKELALDRFPKSEISILRDLAKKYRLAKITFRK